MKHVLAAALVAFAVGGCSSLQVDRDLQHAKLADQYRNALSTAAPFDGQRLCTGGASLNAWSTVTFTAATAIVELPNGIRAEAVCLTLPANARMLQIDSDARGGMTYYEVMAVYPSLLFLDAQLGVVEDFPKPKLSPGDGFSGLQLTGNLVIDERLAKARHVVVYVHPRSVDGLIDVQTGYQSIPVPYTPYGQVRVRFR